MNRFLKISEAAELLGVSPQTLRRWEKAETLLPDRKTKGGTRYYDLARIRGKPPTDTELTLCYARVSSHDQRGYFQRQAQVLGDYCASRGWTYEVIEDLGSGMNYRKKGLKRLLSAILERKSKTPCVHPQGPVVEIWSGARLCPLRG